MNPLKPFLKTSLLVFILLGLINFSYSQTECECSKISDKEKQLLIEESDSLKIYNAIALLKKNNQAECKYAALQLEFDYLSNERVQGGILKLINEQEELNNYMNCKENLFNISYNYVIYYRIINDFEKLSESAFEALKEAEKLNDINKEIQIIKQIVYLFTRMKEKTKRWNYVKRAETLILNDKDVNNKVSNYRWLAYEYENEYTKTERKTLIDSALTFINKVKNIAIQENLNDEAAMLYRASEAFSYHKGELTKALVYIDSAIFYAKKIKGRKNISGFYLSKAWDHYDLKQFEMASIWMDSALYYDDKTDIAGHMMLQSEASEIFEGSGALNKAILSLKAHSKLKDSILSKQRSKAINELETKYQTELKDAQIKRLTVLLIVASFSIVSLLLIGTLIRLKQSRKQNEKLRIAFEKQIALEKELSDVRDEIAQDFHDDLGNKLARISLLSQLVSGEVSLNDNKVKSKLEQITEDANGLYTGTRDFIFSLKSNSDYLDEVVTYLSDFGEEFYKKTNIKFEVSKSIDFNEKLPYYWSKQLIYIFKEAMTNALKYSESKTVTLKFEYINKKLKIECIDMGIGINATNLNSENGLSNMKSRAQKIGGKLNIISNPGAGTTIQFYGEIS